MRAAIAILLLILVLPGANATTLANIPLSELFSEADVVALVEVAEGHLLEEGPETCGAVYRATVKEGLKGIKAGETVEFGPYFGYQIGDQYLLFLTKPGRSFDPKSSTNGAIESAQQSIVQRCQPKWKFLAVMHSGNGALPVNWSSQFEYKDSVRIPTRYIGIPKTIETKPAMPSDNEKFSSVVWVRLETMLNALRGLQK